MIEFNVLNIVQFIIIAILIIMLMYEIREKIIIYKECDHAIEKIVSDNLVSNLTKEKKLNKKFSRIIKKLLGWVYRTLKSSTEISEQVKQVYNSCNASLKKSESIKSKFHEFNEKANSTLMHLEKLNNLCKATYDSQEKIYALSNKSSQTASSAGEYINSGSDSVEIALKILEDMNVSIENLTNYVGNLSEITVKVDDMAQLINKLSTDINLLSLNASIEAARAGEAGKGFAVVASEIGHLADETSEYSRNIKTSINEINKKTNEVINAMKGLSKKRSEAEESTNSIKIYFKNINKEIVDIINSVKEVSENVKKELLSSKEIKATSQNVEQFFNEFSEDMDIIRKDIDHQYDTERENIESCDNMFNSIKAMREFTQEFENIISNKLIEHCKIICKNLMEEKIGINDISKYCIENGISEVYITNHDGVTVLSNNDSAIGFRFPEDESSQAHVFRKILESSDSIISQNFQKRDLDNKYYKFVAIARKDCKGIVQAGLDVEDILALKI